MSKKKTNEKEKSQPEAESKEKTEEIEKVDEAKQPKAKTPAERPLKKAERMKEHLAKQPKVRIIIPLEPNEKPGGTESVILNGYPFFIKKGVYVEVPEQVADVIMESRKETDAAFERAKQRVSDTERPEFDNSK
jgi:hypothetical protein